jgi:PAS domain S-box-containing protein
MSDNLTYDELKRRVNELEESERTYRALIENSPDLLYRTDLQGRIVFISPSVYDLSGYTHEEAIGMKLAEEVYLIPEERNMFLAKLQKKGTVTNFEARLKRKDGSTWWASTNAHFLNDKDGNIIGIEGIARDISELKKTGKALRESEKKYQNLFNNAQVALFRTSIDGKLLEVNKRYAEMAGYSDVEDCMAEFNPANAWVDPIGRNDFLRILHEKGFVNDFETQIIRRDGAHIWILFSAAIIPEQGFIEGSILEITDRKQIEGSLRESETRFKALHNASFGGIVIHDKGKILDCNQGLSEITGYTFDELIGTDGLRLIAPDWLEEVVEKMMSTAEEPFEVEGIRKDGTKYPLYLQSKLIPYKGRSVRVWEFRDISAQKKTEEALQQNYIQLKAIYNTLPVVISSLDENGIFTLSEGQELTTIGLQPGELVGLSAFDFFKDNPLVIENIKAALAGQFCEYETEVSGAIYHSFLTPYYNENNRVCGLNGLAVNITEKKLVEAEIRSLRNYLNNIIDSMPSIIVGVDSNHCVTQWNKMAENTTGITAEKARGKSISDVLPRMMPETDKITRSIKTRQVIQNTKRGIETNNGMVYEDLTIYPLAATGVEGAVIRIDDVTDKVRLEEMMIQSEKMLSVGGIASGMAHEINNPLAGVLQNADVLTNRLLGDLPANHEAAEAAGTSMAAIRKYLELRKLPNMLENIRASGSLAATIVKNMLNFARKSDKIVSIHDLGSLLDQALDLLKTDFDMKKHYDFKKIEIVRQYDDTAGPVPCQASKLQQVFMNILKNGAEAMAEVLDAPAPPMFVIRVKDDGVWVRVEIEDNGPGMDTKTRRRIFEPFFTTKPVGKGTGLGLSVSYFIVTEDHGGEMEVNTVANGGTRFIIRLPKTGKE